MLPSLDQHVEMAMADVWKAYEFMQRSTSPPRPGEPRTLGTIEITGSEACMKAFLADRQGLKGSFESINEQYEIRMELVERTAAPPADALELSNRIAKFMGL